MRPKNPLPFVCVRVGDQFIYEGVEYRATKSPQRGTEARWSVEVVEVESGEEDLLTIGASYQIDITRFVDRAGL